MVHALKDFFGSLSTWLIILKYLGLALAAGASVWATINDLTVTERGRRRLTYAGIVSIILTIVGLTISIVSEDLQRRQAASDQAARLSEEAKRTNGIIIAGQPLTSLNVAWSFRGLDADLVNELDKGEKDAFAFIEDQQGERDGQQNSAVLREKQLYPFLVALSRRLLKDTAKGGDADVIVLVPLDDDQNSVLPFGFLDAPKLWCEEGIPCSTSLLSARREATPSVEIGSHGDMGNRNLLSWPELKKDKANATIAWHLDPSTFAKSFNRQNQFIVPTAKLPSGLSIAILIDITGLPFTPGNFALPEDQGFWELPDEPDTMQKDFQGKVLPLTKEFSSSVQLIPNNSSIVSYNYVLSQIYESQIQDTYGEANQNIRCLVLEYKLEN